MKFVFMVMSVLSVVFVFSSEIRACSCSWNPNPPCRAYGQADLIFDGVVLAIDKVKTNTDFPLKRRAKIKVVKSYKGATSPISYVYTGDGRSDCGFTFKKGSRYLIYANSSDGFITTNKCGRNSEIKKAGDDLDYLVSWPLLPSGITVYGTVEQYIKPGDFQMLPKVRIQIDGPEIEVLSLETDQEGKFVRNGLRAGHYSVKAMLPGSFVLSTVTMNDYYPLPLFEEDVPNKGCIEARFILESKK